MADIYKKAHVTHVLILVNIIVFLLETLCGGSTNQSVAIIFGAAYTPLIIEKLQLYRLITACFLHFGLQHLLVNMLSLFALGAYAEDILGKNRFFALYIISGICGNLLALAVELVSGVYHISAGASGAISGLLGVFVYLALTPEGRKRFPLINVGLAVLCLLDSGFSSSSVNVWAHIGGLAAGLAVAALLGKIRS